MDKADSALQSATKADVGLGNVDNTSDANKPVSTATQAAIDAVTSNAAGSVAAANTQRRLHELGGATLA